jgi:hypothetical protein
MSETAGNDAVILRLTRAEALVLFEWLATVEPDGSFPAI